MLNPAALRRTVVLLGILATLPAIAFAQRDGGDARDRPGEFIINRPASLYTRPSADSKILRQIRPKTVVRVTDVVGQWYKVESTKGHESGFVRRSYADPASDGRRDADGSGGGGGSGPQRFRVGMFKLTDPVIVRDQPSMSGRKIATLREGAEVRVVDKDSSKLWYKIQSESGDRPPGWIPVVAAKRVGDAP